MISKYDKNKVKIAYWFIKTMFFLLVINDLFCTISGMFFAWNDLFLHTGDFVLISHEWFFKTSDLFDKTRISNK